MKLLFLLAPAWFCKIQFEDMIFFDCVALSHSNWPFCNFITKQNFNERMPSRHSVQLSNDLVVAYPDIYQVALGSDAEFIVLATDGLWDYMSRSITWSLESVVTPFFIFWFVRNYFTFSYYCSSEAVSLVRDQLRKHGNIQVCTILYIWSHNASINKPSKLQL